MLLLYFFRTINTINYFFLPFFCRKMFFKRIYFRITCKSCYRDNSQKKYDFKLFDINKYTVIFCSNKKAPNSFGAINLVYSFLFHVSLNWRTRANQVSIAISIVYTRNTWPEFIISHPV